ncbi:helix-turn-helix domain-containing protein (plasmid) [Borreliella carolinensis]|nr:helix-turn-helix domain-containing protein [Borreliella carolinensis]WNY63332.1 helix-turn-helix domain-containing protein [Borreliella carolinensis]
MLIKLIKTKYILTLIKRNFSKVFGFVRFLYNKMLDIGEILMQKTKKVLV